MRNPHGIKSRFFGKFPTFFVGFSTNEKANGENACQRESGKPAAIGIGGELVLPACGFAHKAGVRVTPKLRWRQFELRQPK